MSKNIDPRDLEGFLNSKIRIAVNHAGEAARKELYNFVKVRWYNNYDPIEYDRTFDYLNSITKMDARVINGVIVAEVYFDASKIRSEIRTGTFNAHASWDGNSVNEMIPEWIEYGFSRKNNIVGRDDQYARNGLHTMNYLQSWLKEKYVTIIKKELRKQGLTIK